MSHATKHLLPIGISSVLVDFRQLFNSVFAPDGIFYDDKQIRCSCQAFQISNLLPKAQRLCNDCICSNNNYYFPGYWSDLAGNLGTIDAQVEKSIYTNHDQKVLIISQKIYQLCKNLEFQLKASIGNFLKF